ncbi:MAG: hypothetical protein EOP06_10485 [Proteobacteria bacterium]|nr:MAG: hypothetical protein EOP06_10485 [Pseudomonadota bacterium]
MKKILFLLLTAALSFSCNDDDSSSGPKLKPLSAAVVVGGETELRTYSYDEKDRMSSVTVDNVLNTFTYDGENRVTRVTNPDGSIDFAYDEDGKLTTITVEDGEVLTVEMPNDNTYFLDGSQFSFNDNGDWSLFQVYAYSYTSGKGPFANVKHLNLLAMAFIDEQSQYFVSRKRISNISIGMQYPVVYGEGTDGMPSSFAIEGITATFAYTE